ncbi:transcription antitermination factor NusB [Candidatus Dependentiae bacterium]|jgi:N utilization substance protein B|nr:transcription antitermination factor NusB [Candidatus Dependentiae bacterium]
MKKKPLSSEEELNVPAENIEVSEKTEESTEDTDISTEDLDVLSEDASLLPEELNTLPIDAELDHEQQQAEALQEVESEEVLIKLDSRRDERCVAFYLCYAVDRFDYAISLEKAVRDFDNWFEIDIDEHPFTLDLARGAIDCRDELDEQVKPYLKNWRLERLGCCTRLILRLALWELRQDNAIHSIIINEAVELAKTFAEKDAYKFVNGVLDEFFKQKIAHAEAKK